MLAQYVKKIHADTTKIDQSVWTHVQRILRDEALFPNLCDLLWAPASLYSSELLLFATPSLRTLEFRYIYARNFSHRELSNEAPWIASFQMLFSSFLSIATGLHTIRISGADPHLTASFIPKLKAVKSIKILSTISDTISTQTLAVLAALPSLERLEFNSVDDGSGDPGFHNLRALIIHELPAEDDFCTFFRSPHLRSLTIYNHGSSPPETFQESCRCWAASFPALEELSCSVEGFLIDYDEPLPPLADLVNPLLPLSTLTTLDLTCVLPAFAATDASLAPLAQAWPRLTSLVLWDAYTDHSAALNDPDVPRPPCATPIALLALARGLPALRTLSLPGFAASAADLAPARVRAYPLLAHGLSELWVGHVDIAEPAFCAVLLDRLFPALEVPEELEERAIYNGVAAVWWGVLSAYAALKFARRQEKERRALRRGEGARQ